MKGSLTKTNRYPIPIYSPPKNFVIVDLYAFDKRFKEPLKAGLLETKEGTRFATPFPYSRAQINEGAIDKISKVVA